MGMLRVGIIGAGVVGLTTAQELQAELPNASCTLLADKFNKETTSDGAAGIFRPSTGFTSGDIQTTKQWIAESYDFYNDLRSQNCGVSQVSGFIFSSTSPALVKNHFLEDVVPVYRAATSDELSLCPGDWKYGSYFTTLLIECRYYLPWALERFKQNGGLVQECWVADLSELASQFDVVVNCSGLGAQQLCVDLELVPIRGQVVKVRADWLKHFWYADYDTYVIPSSGGVATLGGTRQYESYRMETSRHDSADILERCCALVPRLVGCRMEGEWVGLRPHRPHVRVEAEVRGRLKIVHNYGHGGYGVTTAPGTAKHAVRLVKQLMAASSKL